MAEPQEPRETSPLPPRSLFADDPMPPAPPERPTVPSRIAAKRKHHVFARIMLPVAVLIGGIACIAWVAQYLPSRRARMPAPREAVANAIQFQPGKFVWNPDEKGEPADSKYTIPEFELGVPGHYDYKFTNTSAGEVELGVAETSCTCTGVSVCVFKSDADREEYRKDKESTRLNWTKLEVDRDLRTKITVPGKAEGAVRIAWSGAKTEPEHVRLNTRVWSRGAPGQDPTIKDLVVLVNYVRPVKFYPETIELGTMGPKDQRTASFVCWSATRDFDVKSASDDKLLDVVARKLDDKQRETLEKEMRAHSVMTRIRVAYKVTVTLAEEDAGRQLDMGLFLKPVPLALTSDGQTIEAEPPMLRATVLGDVALGPETEGSRIDFGIFSAKSGKTKKVTLFSPKNAELSFVGCDPVLLDLEVQLKKLKMVGEKAHWQMDITAKPNRDPGLLPENGVIVLRSEVQPPAAATPVSRLVRIHVTGTAESRH